MQINSNLRRYEPNYQTNNSQRRYDPNCQTNDTSGGSGRYGQNNYYQNQRTNQNYGYRDKENNAGGVRNVQNYGRNYQSPERFNGFTVNRNQENYSKTSQNENVGSNETKLAQGN